ncbi:MAG TPA: hypothetical protein VGQ52_12345 [Gemmatimonadaceae bacterium]|nr:hypothetical protein [Gemmatimonadaceae bacterium]
MRLRTRAVTFALAAATCGVTTHLGAQAPLLTQLSAQQHSRSVKWRQIVTPHFTLIFSDSMTADAQRAATLLERAYDPLIHTLGKRPERIPVLLAAQSLIPNAFVSWFPRRTIWHPLPKTSADFAGPVEWYNILAVHEGRHIAQERLMRSGIIGLASRIFGDEATALLAGRLYFPDWLWEGDAVGTETALTLGGRGRQPSFMNRVRAMRLTGQEYPHYPAWLRSYRTYYPGAYELGYLLTAYARRTYGPDVWAKVIRRATRNPLTPYALSMALSAETGKSLGELHRDALAEADSIWRTQAAQVRETAATTRTQPRRGYHVWHWPQYASDGSIIAAYTDLDNVTPLVRIDRAGREEILLRHFPGRGEFPFHVAADRVIWLEYDVDPRWGLLDYLTIKELNLGTRRVRTVRDGTRIYAVALSPDGTRIAALEMSGARRSRLLLLDSQTGAVVRDYPNAANHFLTNPAWSEDGQFVTFVAIGKTRGNALVRLSVESAASDTLVPWTFDAMSQPAELGGRVFFGSPQSGIDNIHAVDVSTKQQYQVTSRRFGAYHADVATIAGRATLLFRDYGANGDEIAEALVEPATWPVANNGMYMAPFVEPLVVQEATIVSVDSATVWPVQPYRGLRPIRHSMAIFPGDDVEPWIIQTYSRNVLNTFGQSFAYRFNPARGTQGLDFGLSYAGLFPIFDLGLRVGTDASTYDDSTGATIPFKWRERSTTLTARLPLTAVRGLAVQQLVAAASLGYTHIEGQPVEFPLDNNNGTLNTMTYTLFAAHSEPAAYRDLVGTGVYALGRYRHTPFGGDYFGHAYMLQAGASMRGPFRHHGLSAIAAIEEQRPTNYAYSSELPFARGYDARARFRIWRAGGSYALPLWYPDLNVGPLLFVRRLQAEAFGDYSIGYSSGGRFKTYYRSAGVELTSDFVPFSMNQTWRAGVRYSYRVDADEPWRMQAIIRIP